MNTNNEAASAGKYSETGFMPTQYHFFCRVTHDCCDDDVFYALCFVIILFNTAGKCNLPNKCKIVQSFYKPFFFTICSEKLQRNYEHL